MLQMMEIREYSGFKSSRVRFLEQQLSTLNYTQGLKAFDLVLGTMNVENGFERHNGEHFYYHLVDVTQDLLNLGILDEDIITSALLHDFIEDIDWGTYEYVEQVFGHRVANIVQILTKDPSIDYKTDEEAMKKYVKIIESYYETALIKTADRTHNISTMLNSTDKHRNRQVKETRDIYIPFFKRCRNKYPRYSAYFFGAKTRIEPILHEIERNLSV